MISLDKRIAYFSMSVFELKLKFLKVFFVVEVYERVAIDSIETGNG